jgi:hypothetical protein
MLDATLEHARVGRVERVVVDVERVVLHLDLVHRRLGVLEEHRRRARLT